MNRTRSLIATALLWTLAFGALTAEATEVHLRSEVILPADTSIVTLGHLAQVVDRNPNAQASLAAIELFPAPQQTKIIPVRQLQERLALLGVDVVGVRFQGASSVLIRGAAPHHTGSRIDSSEVNRRDPQSARQRIEESVQQHLTQMDHRYQSWNVTAQFDSRYVDMINRSASTLQVRNRRPLEAGTHQLVVDLQTDQGPRTIPVRVQLLSSDQAVFLIQPVQRGEIIRAEHLQVKPIDQAIRVQDLVYRPDEILGHEAKRALPAGKPLSKQWFQTPRLIKRGDPVTVYATAEGIRVRTTGKALEEGGYGDVIRIESVDRKHKYVARVVNYREAEVFASPQRTIR